jgi:long-chain acyl-CoA synthetase
MKTQLSAAYENESKLADRVWLTQPMGGGDVRDLTWREAMGEVRRVAAHLRSLDLPRGSRIAIFSKNCAWWFLADLAIWSAGHVTVPIYPTLTADSIRQILDHSEAKAVFVGKLDGYAEMRPGIPDQVTKLALPLSPEKDAMRWADILERAKPLEGTPDHDPDDLATIVYTSGSTGAPKGVMHSFRTMCAAQAVAARMGMSVEDRAISYLPLAHVGERACVETPNFFLGFHVYFAESLDTFVEDVKRARPTIFGSVPRLWLKFQSGIFQKMHPKKLERLLRIPIVNRFVKKRVLEGLGLDQVRYALCGSAPVPPELLEWFGRLGLAIQELYGMTENFAVSHMTREEDRKVGWVGSTLPGVEQKLSDEGEVLVKGPGTMLGYYSAPQLTKETLDSDGFLHTGDRGELDAKGQLRITGRMKELFKTSKGKYVAPAPIENLLVASRIIEQACVTGSGAPQPIALVALAEAARRAARDELETELVALRDAINRALDPHERLDRLVVVAGEWTVDNRLLTPTMKVKRSAVEERYATTLANALAAREAVIWESPS